MGRSSESGEIDDRAGPIVLAVDDQQVNLDVIRASLMPFGYRVAEARSVREALGLIERARPAVVVCDLHMPRESGFDLIECVRERAAWRTIPFAFVSSTPWEHKDRDAESRSGYAGSSCDRLTRSVCELKSRSASAMATIVVADDDAASRMLMTTLLEHAGHTVTAVASGGEALDLVRRGPPDLVLTDLSMPGIAG